MDLNFIIHVGPLESSIMVTHVYYKQLLDEVEHDIMN